MIAITVNDNNRTYTGETWEEVLAKLHKDQLCPEKTDVRYMKAVASRTRTWKRGSLVRTDSALHFFADLARMQLVHIVPIL